MLNRQELPSHSSFELTPSKLQQYRIFLQTRYWKTGNDEFKNKLDILDKKFGLKKHRYDPGFSEWLLMSIFHGKMSELNPFFNDKACINELLNLSNEMEKIFYKNIQEYPYEDMMIDGYLYPVLLDENKYRKTTKDHTLRNYLVNILSKRGVCSGEVVQFFGILPGETFDEQMKKQVYFTESSNGMILFHGKHAHMLQYYLLSCFVKKPENTSTFIQGFLKNKIWGQMFDNSAKSVGSCLNPYYLHSLILTDPSLKNSFLSKYLRDVFFQHSVELKKALVDPKLNLSMKEFFNGIDRNFKINELNVLVENAILNDLAIKKGLELPQNYQVEFFITKKSNNEKPIIITNEHTIKDNLSQEKYFEELENTIFGSSIKSNKKQSLASNNQESQENIINQKAFKEKVKNTAPKDDDKLNSLEDINSFPSIPKCNIL